MSCKISKIQNSLNSLANRTDGKADVGRVSEEKRRSKKIREEKESEERRCRCAKKQESRANHGVFPMICGSRGSKSRLAKAAGAEPSGQMRDAKLHAVVSRSTFRSQKLEIAKPGRDPNYLKTIKSTLDLRKTCAAKIHLQQKCDFCFHRCSSKMRFPKNKMQPTNPNAHTYVNGTDVKTHGYAATHNTFLQ